MSARDSARARWRADLHEFGAEALRGAGLTEMADRSVAAAETARAYAALMAELAAAKAGRENNPDSDWHKDILKDVKLRVFAFRNTERTFGPPTIGIVDNFAEPSDAELIELGY